MTTRDSTVQASPHYRYHGAMVQSDTLRKLDSLVPFDKAARAYVARTMIALWESGSGDRAGVYLERLARIVLDRYRAGATMITTDDLVDTLK